MFLYLGGKIIIMKNLTFLALAALLIISCKETPKEAPIATDTPNIHPNMAKAEWFVGEWENKSAEGDLVENWKKLNDSLFMGESYFIVKGDTVFAEKVALADLYGKMSYNVTVPDQNNGETVSFEMTSVSDKEVVFENPQHDYPSKIVYTHVAEDSLVAVISGNKNGKPATETFKMKRK